MLKKSKNAFKKLQNIEQDISPYLDRAYEINIYLKLLFDFQNVSTSYNADTIFYVLFWNGLLADWSLSSQYI